ncbi:MAG: GNAT family N-acetyltransferase [Acidobacteria bacterium]|nr:GNAT family N-acetyltransferase [Acidobacteriota bacterium]
MEKNVTLKDGRQIVIRGLLEDDADAVFAFFARLPEEDRKYLRVDVTKYESLTHRYVEVKNHRACRLVAVAGDEIVADGALELKGHGWGENVGEIRLIVSRSFQRTGLGTLLARELYFLAAEHKVERIVARVMKPQVGAHRIMNRLGFHDEFCIPSQIKDQDGKWQDLIIMRCNLEDMWREMEGFFDDSDWQRHR